MTGELEGKIAFITGASRGIGLATARELTEAGARVAIIARDKGKADEAAKDVSGSRCFACDVTDVDSVTEVVGAVQAEMGPIDILVNNAGDTRDQLLVRMTDEDWTYALDVNLTGTFNTIRAVARGMMRQRSGVIINVSSVVGLVGNAGQANYAAAKAGLVGLTKSVAKELAGRGIRANLVVPGFIDTQMTADLAGEARKHLAERILMGRLGEPEDVAPVIRFLASPGAGYITGQVIVVDGGMVM
ncbi:MAG: 3-oxoacyl-[acyl-carrier-protein] reductase [Candidatus Palauibacterales bacterium]|nr:3-oxoacyl-[acyl-carrier-protein] reductase [Candidatus Palauibacterales bacterium]